jgi:hypothetical protein
MRVAAGRLVSLALALATGLLGACGPEGPADALARRCVDVLRFRHAGLADLRVREAPGRVADARTLVFEGVLAESGARIESRITCVFAPGERYSLARIEVAGRSLTEAEVALVNSELLLRDLSENPERLAGSPRGS